MRDKAFLPRCSVAIALAACALWSPHASADGGFVIVVHATNPLTSVAPPALKKLCTGGTKLLDNGAVVHIGVIPDEVPETQHLASLVGLSTRDLLSRMQEQVFKGEMRRPATLRSSADCAAFAASTPGGLCVASSSTPLTKDAKVLPVR
jgi:hypothetical protein